MHLFVLNIKQYIYTKPHVISNGVKFCDLRSIGTESNGIFEKFLHILATEHKIGSVTKAIYFLFSSKTSTTLITFGCLNLFK